MPKNKSRKIKTKINRKKPEKMANFDRNSLPERIPARLRPGADTSNSGKKENFFHRLWFSKKNDHTNFPKWADTGAEPQKKPKIGRNEGDMEKRIDIIQNELEQRIDTLQSMELRIKATQDYMDRKLRNVQEIEYSIQQIIKELIVDTRNENERMKHESQDILNRLENLINEKNGQQNAQAATEALENEQKISKNFAEPRKEKTEVVHHSIFSGREKEKYHSKNAEENVEATSSKITKNEASKKENDSSMQTKREILNVVYEMPASEDNSTRKGKGNMNEKNAGVAEPFPESKSDAYVAHGKNDDNIKTSLDVLMELINLTGSIKLSDAAKKLHVKDRQIEDWAHMLEEHGLIDVHYPTFGKLILKKKAIGGVSRAR